MAQTVIAAVSRAGAPEYSVEHLRLDDPRPGEVLVRFTASGLCHLALHRRGRFPIERLVRVYPLAEINTAVADLRTGSTVKAVLQHGPAC